MLRVWRERDEPTVRDLQRLLVEAERLGFVERGTNHDLAGGQVLDPKYLPKSEYSHKFASSNSLCCSR